MDFQVRILNKSGLSEETFFPPGGAALGAPPWQGAAAASWLPCP